MGAKQGRTKGNEQKAEYLEPERRHGKPGQEYGEKQGSESGTEKPMKQAARQTRWKRGKERTEAE